MFVRLPTPQEALFIVNCHMLFEDIGQESAYAEYFMRAGIPLAKRWCEKRGFPIANEGAG